MPWSPFILTVFCFGIIYGNRLDLDNRFKQLSAPYPINVKNSDAERVARLEGIAMNDDDDENNLVFDNYKREKMLEEPLLCPQDGTFERYYDLTIDCSSRKDLKLEYESSAGGREEEELKSNPGKELRSILPTINDFYADLLDEAKEINTKRNIGPPVPPIGCDCKIKNDLLDLGQRHFPRYLLNAVCQSDDNQPRCWRGICKPLEYKVKVLTLRTSKDHAQRDPALAWLPDDLRHIWKFKTVTVAAGCFCAIG